MRDKLEKWINCLSTIVLALPFVATGYLHMIAFVIIPEGMELLRTAFVFGVQGLAALVLMFQCLLLWRQRKEQRPLMMGVAALPIVYMLLYVAAYVLHPQIQSILVNFITGMCTLVSICCVFLIVFMEKKAKVFLQCNRYMALLISPIILFYCIRFYIPMGQIRLNDLGVIDYMTLAYTLFTMCIFLLAEDYFLQAPKGKLHAAWIRRTLYFLFTVAITLSGTKGTMLCHMFSVVLIVAFSIAQRKKVRFAVKYAVGVAACIALFSSILYPSVSGTNRLMAFLNEFGSVSVSTDEIQDVSTIMQKPVEEPSATGTDTTSEPVSNPSSGGQETGTSGGESGNQGTSSPSTGTDSDSNVIAPEEGETEQTTGQASAKPVDLENPSEVVQYVNGGQAQKDLENGLISEEEFQSLQDMTYKINNTSSGARIFLWTCALEEIKQAPFLGQGIMSFQAQYGTYPHNYFIEIATDFGVPAMLLVLFLGLGIIITLVKKSITQPYIAVFMFYVLSYLPRQMISGSAYGSDVFFQYGMCIVLALYLYMVRKRRMNVEEL